MSSAIPSTTGSRRRRRWTRRELLATLSPEKVKLTELAGEKIEAVLTRAPGNDAPIGGLKVVTKSGWFAARPSGTESIYKIYAESFQGTEHLRRLLEEAQRVVGDALATAKAPRRSEGRPSSALSEADTMSTQPRVDHPAYGLLPRDIEGFDSLAELALDLRWSWNHATDGVWRQLDPALWEFTHNPWVVLQTVSRDKLRSVLADPAFRKDVDSPDPKEAATLESPGWFQKTHPRSVLTCAAYFSMEFMLSEALPIYSGGLGNVAGDQLKATSDLGMPVVGVGLLYQQGYFRQVIDKDGAQQALFPYNDPGQLPITPVRQANGEWLRLEVSLPGYSVWLRAWEVRVGRAKLYLLDSNDAANLAAHRGITSELYGGGPELRLKQELLLGIGGWRLLARAGTRPGGLSSERRACGLRDSGARADLHGRQRAALRSRADRHAGREPLHDAHGGGRWI